MAYDSSATRQRILEAAIDEFAAHGIAGGRVDRIAAKAKANKQAIYAYFGNKEALFGKVLEYVMSEIAEAVPVTGEDLPGYAAKLFDYHREHPEVVRLLLWEGLEFGEDAVPAESTRIGIHEAKSKATASAQQAGDVAGELDPGVLMFFIISLVNWYSAVPQIRRMLGADVTPEVFQQQLVSAVRKLVAHPAR